MVNPETPVLVVDFGTTFSAANLIDGGRVHFVTDELTGDRAWPTSIYFDADRGYVVGNRAEQRKHEAPLNFHDELKMHLVPGATLPLAHRNVPVRDLVAVFLGVLRAEAETLASAPVTRVLVTIPGAWHPGSARRAELHAACRAAGFDEVEMLFEPVAAAHATQADDLFGTGSRILVYDLGGGSFDMALVRVGAVGHDRIPAHGLIDHAGRQIDQVLVATLAESTTDATADRDGQLELMDIARRLKCRLSAETEATAPRSWLGSGLRLTASDLKAAASELIDGTIEAAQQFLDDESCPVDELDGVLLVGGGSRMSLVVDAVTEAFRPVPVRRPGNPEFAVIDGATHWRQAGTERRARPAIREPGEIPLRWPIPGDVATVSRWLVDPGQPYESGAPLVRVALTDGAHWELCASAPGVLRQQHATIGGQVRGNDWLVTAISERPGKGADVLTPYRWRTIPVGGGIISVTPDFRWAACARTGEVDLIDLTTGATRPLWRSENATIYDLSIHHAAKHVAIALPSGEVRLIEVASDTETTRTYDGVGTNTRVAFAPTGDVLAVSAADTNRLYLCRDTDFLGTPTDLENHGYSVAWTEWSPDGTRLLPAGRHTGALEIRDQQVTSLPRINGGNINSVVFVDDEHLMALRPSENHVRRFDVTTGAEEQPFSEDAALTHLAADEARDLIALADDKSVRLRTQDGTARGRVNPNGSVTGTALSPDGYRLLIATAQEIQIYGLDTAPLAAADHGE
jgi:actin-like ATPase involved in cell morphogenesis